MREILKTLGVLGNPVRLRLRRLLRGQELCVCEFVDALRIPQYAVSRHLRSLRALGLVAARRDGRWMHYRLGSAVNDRGPAAEVLAVLCRHLESESALRRDDATETPPPATWGDGIGRSLDGSGRLFDPFVAQFPLSLA